MSNHYADCNLKLATERTESLNSFLRQESLQTLTTRKSDVYRTKFSLMKELQNINLELIEIDYELGEMERNPDLRKNRKKCMIYNKLRMKSKHMRCNKKELKRVINNLNDEEEFIEEENLKIKKLVSVPNNIEFGEVDDDEDDKPQLKKKKITITEILSTSSSRNSELDSTSSSDNEVNEHTDDDDNDKLEKKKSKKLDDDSSCTFSKDADGNRRHAI